MATSTTSKAIPRATASAGTTGNGQTSTASVADTKLLNYVRGNAPQIVASITLAASQAGEGRDWVQMNEYLTLANTISGLCGLGQLAGGGTVPVQAMAAGAGR